MMRFLKSDDSQLDVLLVEDSAGDVRLTREAFRDAGVPDRTRYATK